MTSKLSTTYSIYSKRAGCVANAVRPIIIQITRLI